MVTREHVHAGGVLCGQTMMAAADTAMVLALIRHFGQFRPCSTVQLSIESGRMALEMSGVDPASIDALVDRTVAEFGRAFATGEPQLHMGRFINRKR